MKSNMLIVHGGAPTAVINASLYGALKAAMSSGVVDKVYGARGGSKAILTGNYVCLSDLDEKTIEKLPFTPASFIGTSRYPVTDAEYDLIVDKLEEQHIKYLLFTGGNGSMDTCGKIALRVAARGKSLFVGGIPKTIDNDIAVTDHAPGFGSAARYLAASVRELSQDIASLPIHVSIIEGMGRNAGWLTAASVLAKKTTGKNKDSLGPHLIYVPEVPFDEEDFLDSAKTLYDRYGGVVVVASEGLKYKDGTPIVEPIFSVGRSVYYGDVSAHLCNLVIKKLGVKARSEKPGVLGRCSIAWQSSVDREEAILAGKTAAQAVLAEKSGYMAGFKRISSSPYKIETVLIPVEEVMLHERMLPLSYLTADKKGLNQDFIDWCQPLIGEPFCDFAELM